MTTADLNPTDVLAQKRAEKTVAAVPSPAQLYWADRLGSPEGRAAIFAELLDANLFGEAPPPPASDRDLWMWLGNRSRAARLFQEAMEIAPLAVGSMFAEAMQRVFEQQAGKNQ